MAITTQTSYAKQGQEWLKENKAEFNAQQDLKGPFTLAVLAQKQPTAPEPKSPPEASGKQTATSPVPQEGNVKKSTESQIQKEPAPKKAEEAQKPDEAQKAAAPNGDSATSEKEQKTAYLAVFGDTDFADNTYFNISGNGDLFLNTVNFLASEESQISLRAPEKKSQPLLLTGYQGWALLFVCLIFIPLAIIIAGTSAYLRRRSRR